MNISEALRKNLIHDATPKDIRPTQLSVWKFVFKDAEGHVRYSPGVFNMSQIEMLFDLKEKVVSGEISEEHIRKQT